MRMSEEKHQEKPFLTYQEQVDKLKKDKRLQIEDEERAIDLLKRHSYFALVSGYKKQDTLFARNMEAGSRRIWMQPSIITPREIGRGLINWC